MLPRGKTAVIHRELLEQLNVGGQPDARVRALDQVMAEQRCRRKPVPEDLVKRTDIVDCLTVKNRFQKQILLRIGNGPGIRVGTGGIGENPREAGSRSAGQSDADPRLNDGLPFLANVCYRVGLDPVQRVRDSFDEPARRIGRQLRVGIERDDVSNRQRQMTHVENPAAFTTQKRIQLLQFSAFALAADPALLALGPNARPVKQHEAVAPMHRAFKPAIPSRAVCSSSASNGCRRFRSVGEIGKKTVENVVVAVAQKSDFQFFDFSPYRFPPGQHHRNHYQGGVLRGDARSKIQFWQRIGGQQRNHTKRVDDLNRQFTEREYRERAQGYKDRDNLFDARGFPCQKPGKSTVKQAVNPMLMPRYTGVA